MKNEFNLSEKVLPGETNVYVEDDVKEFIKILKEETSPYINSVLSKPEWEWLLNKIDKLAGSSLLGTKGIK